MNHKRSSNILDLMANAIDEWIALLSAGNSQELFHRLERAKKDIKLLIEKEEETKISVFSSPANEIDYGNSSLIPCPVCGYLYHPSNLHCPKCAGEVTG